MRSPGWIAFLSLMACGADALVDEPGSGPKADDPGTGAVTTLSFEAGWRQHQSGPIVEGGTLRIAYDLSRMTECRSRDRGSDVWGVTGYLSVDGGPASSFALSRLVGGTATPEPATVAIPKGARGITLWFSINDRWGCLAWDSVYGANYGFAVASREPDQVATVRFDATGRPSTEGVLRAGGELIVHVDPARLATCSGASGGQAAWAITAHVLVDGRELAAPLVTRADGPDLVAADPRLALPAGSELGIWLEATSRWGCHAVDDDGGQPYRLALD